MVWEETSYSLTKREGKRVKLAIHHIGFRLSIAFKPRELDLPTDTSRYLLHARWGTAPPHAAKQCYLLHSETFGNLVTTAVALSTKGYCHIVRVTSPVPPRNPEWIGQPQEHRALGRTLEFPGCDYYTKVSRYEKSIQATTCPSTMDGKGNFR